MSRNNKNLANTFADMMVNGALLFFGKVAFFGLGFMGGALSKPVLNFLVREIFSSELENISLLFSGLGIGLFSVLSQSPLLLGYGSGLFTISSLNMIFGCN